MCIIEGEIDSVRNTRILAAIGCCAGATGSALTRQLIVYANVVELPPASKPAAMLLPFPNHNKRGAQVLATVPEDGDFYDCLHRAFSYPDPDLFLDDSFADGDEDSEDGALEVLRAGAYRYSVAETAADLARASPEVFGEGISAGLRALLAQYPADQFGFIVCVLDESATYAPFAYLSDALPGDRLFLPTRHHHTHRGAGANMEAEKEDADWDHEIYVLGMVAHQIECRSIQLVRQPAHVLRPSCAHADVEWPAPRPDRPESALGAMLRSLSVSKTRIAQFRIGADWSCNYPSDGVTNGDMVLAEDKSMRIDADGILYRVSE